MACGRSGAKQLNDRPARARRNTTLFQRSAKVFRREAIRLITRAGDDEESVVELKEAAGLDLAWHRYELERWDSLGLHGDCDEDAKSCRNQEATSAAWDSRDGDHSVLGSAGWVTLPM